MIILLNLFSNILSKESRKKKQLRDIYINDNHINYNNNFLNSIAPILILSLFSTFIFSLLQSGLPLDLVKGTSIRAPLSETFTGLILSLQLGLILIFQWPIGKWLSEKDIVFGLRLGIIFLGNGCLFLALASKFTYGIYLIIFALIFVALGLTAFLPIATEAIIQSSNISNRGIAMAMFSQCFGISAIIAPISAGILIDNKGEAFLLWVILGLISITLIPITNKINVNSK